MKTNKNTPEPKEGEILSSIIKKNNFSVPEDYFDELPAAIMNKALLSSKQKQVSLLKPFLAFSSLAVVCTSIILIVVLKKDVVRDNELADIDIEQIITHPEEYNINETDITDQYISVFIEDAPNRHDLETLSPDEIKSYLEENTDESNIINAL